MFRLIIIITLIGLTISFYDKGKNYFEEKSKKVAFVTEVAKKTFKYKDTK
jgi:hypothetical protein